METNKILSADVLDLLFEGRNKEYGAYDLRKHYNGRLGRALAVTGGVVVVLFCFGFVSGRGKVKAAPVIADTVMLSLAPDNPPPPPPPPQPVMKTPPVATRIFTAPQLVARDVSDDEKPPVNDDLDKVKIGTMNTPGGDDVGVDAGPTAVSDGHT
ncbi:MAG TPA: energy transducer TonB, partial [Puia sp.]|nr:energy transducer TonB [Puia sp.]